jgi:iron complex transport system permease protein
MSQSKSSAGRVVLFVLFLLLAIVALVGISVSAGASDVTVGDAYSSILRKPFPNLFESEVIFHWDDVPGSDGGGLKQYLIGEYGIGWVENAEIIKSKDNKISIKGVGYNKVEITRNEWDKEKLSVKISGDIDPDRRVHDFKAKEANGELCIHESTWLADVCIWNLRIPRIIMGILAGISLGIAGGTMQWALKNPLASPYTLGISHIVAFGISVATLFGGASIEGGAFVILGAAGISTLIATAIILYISSRRWATPERVVLIGIVMTIFFGALTTILMYFGEAEAVKEAVFGMVGGLGLASWDALAYMAGTIVLCAILLILLIFMPSLFGVNERRIRTYAMVVASLLTAITVCFTGTIIFIGLLAPHICRMVIGDNHRFVILVSGLVGAVLLIVLDLVARTVISPVILPVGALTTLIGAPLLAYLIVREGQRAVGLT